MSVFGRYTWVPVFLAVGLFGTGCSGGAASAVENRPSPPAAEPPRMNLLPASVVATASATPPAAKPMPIPEPKTALGGASAPLHVKRLVIASGVHDREPLTVTEPLRADGTPIYAFAELSNPEGASENVRITFERQGGKQRAGDVVLPVPGKVGRHRTWAFTRHIFAPGRWDAVLRSESGTELGRASFDVKQT
ncbi:MAG: DUF2914 domain-containing protein [Myxococcales bacterium]|nr:MAG: DUF2914 domain-containing protein [Myxococcales bacterium]